jgi:hypothetical protein
MDPLLNVGGRHGSTAITLANVHLTTDCNGILLLKCHDEATSPCNLLGSLKPTWPRSPRAYVRSAPPIRRTTSFIV